MFSLFNRDHQNRVDRLEEAFIQLGTENSQNFQRTTNLLERVIAIQERQEARMDRHETRINQLYEEIKGLRTESLRIQRHIFGDEVDGN